MSENNIRVMRAIAIIGVITAHGTAVPDSFTKPSIFVSHFIQSIGCTGVGIFFFLSGYLLSVGKSKDLTFGSFLKKKAISLGIPWMISSNLLYLYVAIRKGGSAEDYFRFVFGYGSLYWFMSVLVALQLLYYFVLKLKHYKIVVVSFMGLSIISLILRWMGIIPNNEIGLNLNIFNWSVFFSAGVLFKDYSVSFLNTIIKLRFLIYIAIIVIVLFSCAYGGQVGYYSSYYIFFELMVIAATICIRDKLSSSKMLLWIGKVSFAIYLWHALPWAGLVANICDRFDVLFLVIARPFLVLFITCFELTIGYYIFKKIKKEGLFFLLSGYRRR